MLLKKKINKFKYYLKKILEKKESDLIKLLNFNSNRNSLEIVDAGFHYGYFSESIIKNFQKKRIKIHAFEPNIFLKKPYSNSIKKYIFRKTIILNNFALSDSNAIATFYTGEFEATNSLLKRPNKSLFNYYPENANLVKQIKVQTICLDNYFRDKKINYVDLIKLDLQGGELMTLKGCNKILDSQMVDILYLECVFIEKYINQPKLYELWQYMETYSYSLFSLENINKGNYNTKSNYLIKRQWNQADAIFISPKVRNMIENF